jgi:RP/EB family microtubule-associated protein
MSNIGMMEGAFFVGRKEILDWINATLDINLQKIEDTASGAVACQLLDIMYPNQVPVAKINWSAKQDFEFVANYKILQTCFTKLGIDKHIDVDRLISGKYMDNLEFMQWYKRFFEMAIPEKVTDYDAYGQRCKGKGGAAYGGGKRTGGAAAGKAPARTGSMVRAPVPAGKPKTADARTAGQENNAPNMTRTGSVRTEKPPASAAAPATKTAVRTNSMIATNNTATEEYVRQIDGLQKENADLKTDIEGLEKERDFYFDKLRDIEVLLQEVEDKGDGNSVSAAIFKILYATADGFETVAAEDGAGTTEDAAPLDEIPASAVDVEETY